MSELIIQQGHWPGVIAGEIEGFLASVGILIGLTQKRKDFLEQVHNDIHGSYKPDEFYQKSLENCGAVPPSIVLKLMIMKHCQPDQKKQLKIWYAELLAIEPMEEVNPLIKMMLPELSNTINTF
jgi:hypothetical protein